MSKLALGSAQFGLRYGVANELDRVGSAALESILALALSAGIDQIDTAIAYGDSESRLGSAGVSAWRVVTKLPALPPGTRNIPDWVESHVRGSLLRLKIPRLDGLLLHRPADLSEVHGFEYLRALESVKERGLIGGAGVSIYSPGELDSVWEIWRPDIVQAPFNVFDRRLVHSGWLTKLVDHGVRIHTRSAFLQGLLLLSDVRRPAWFDRWRQLLYRWQAYCREVQKSPLQVATGFALAQPGIECAIVGVDSRVQLEQVLASVSTQPVPILPGDLSSEDLELLEPSRWKLT